MNLRIASLYTNFRTGRAFFIGLVSFVAFWILWNELPFLPPFDKGLNILNVILSAEASIATSFLLMAGESQDAVQRKQLLMMQHLLEAVKDHIVREQIQIDNIEDIVEKIEKEIE